MTRSKWNISILLVLMLLLVGQTVYAQAGTQTADLKIEGMV